MDRNQIDTFVKSLYLKLLDESDHVEYEKKSQAVYFVDVITRYLHHSVKRLKGLLYLENFKKYMIDNFSEFNSEVHCMAIMYFIVQENPSEDASKAYLVSLFPDKTITNARWLIEFGEKIAETLHPQMMKIMRQQLDKNRKTRKLEKLKRNVTDEINNISELKSIFQQNLVYKANKIQAPPQPIPDEPPPVINSEEDLQTEYLKFVSTCINDLPYEDFRLNLFHSVHQTISDEDLQNVLYDMLGFHAFEFVTCLIKNRERIAALARQTAAPTQSEEERRLLKKLKKKMDRQPPAATSTATNQREQPVFQKIRTDSRVQLKNVHDQSIGLHTKAMVYGKLMNLPSNAVKSSTQKHDEIVIPAKSLSTVDPVRFVSVEELDVIGRLVFKDIEKFNLIQSEVYPVAYHSNQNMLICAPTGAGKTNIALMTMVHQIKNYIEDKVLCLNKFKIVYVCPMKALAAEMAANFQKKLSSLGIAVKEVTGDMQLTRKEIMDTQILVTTPEKWDVITRKGRTDTDITSLLKLLILDEVHLLNSDRGPVLESLVARTLRLVISSQSMIRIVGLSATLPNYMDVARFLRVDVNSGLYYFDDRYRAVPLSQTFIGTKGTRPVQIAHDQDEVCFEKVLRFLKAGQQVMVFVHARNHTVKTAKFFKEMAQVVNAESHFQSEKTMAARKASWETHNPQLDELVSFGIGVHHAGMLRSDRSFIEKAFLAGTIRVLVCTATLAWGVNLPAHAVIIKGTTLYDTKRCGYVDLDILDVLQIFGRAGRPQFDTSGSGIIITTYDKLSHYLSCLTNQVPIESQFLKFLPDNLNAEVVLGTISNVQEAIEWLTYTYLYQRMRVNPQVYGLNYTDLQHDPDLRETLLAHVHNTAKLLDKAHMIRYTPATGEISSTDLGRTASYYYINFDTVEVFNGFMVEIMTEAEIINMMCMASEFQQIQVRQEELEDLDFLSGQYCEFLVPGGPENVHGKVNILLQTYLSRGYIKSLSLASDKEYITQSAVRIARALFDMALHKNFASLSRQCLVVAKMLELQMWPFEHVLTQFSEIPANVIGILQKSNVQIDDLLEMTEKDIGALVRNPRHATVIKQCARAFPYLELASQLQPITRNVVRVRLFVKPLFKWYKKIHGGGAEMFWMWVEDSENQTIYYSESFAITKNACVKEETVELVFTIPLSEPRPSLYMVRVESNRWMYATYVHRLDFETLTLPESFTPHTDLLPLNPLHVSVLKNPEYERLYNFTHFNPIQTQIFHSLYHTDHNILLGAPTGSGKTIVAEICMFRLFNTKPGLKVVYIAPLKALVRERSTDWKKRFGEQLKKKVIEITGDSTPDTHMIQSADLIITTPEKWDGMSRGWQTRDYIKDVGLIVIDEIHLLGEDRGPVIEVIVTRTNFIKNRTRRKMRIVGLSTAMANAGDLAMWLGIEKVGLYNFRPTVRPVPIDVHITGFPGKHYCPRMISMNRPTYQAIRQHAPESPVLVFCSSRKQTRFTASGLITYLLTDTYPKQWLKSTQTEIDEVMSRVHDPDLRYFLNFGIGIHHAGLQDGDRKIVEELFVTFKIQVLIATATLAWGVNFPAHLVVIKGTEYFDGTVKRYVDMPITDILQMIGRAGRPQYDTYGVACVFVHDVKKNFYKRFLYEPFPVESNLLAALAEHVNAEIAAGTVSLKVQLVEYLQWTYFYRRLLENPSYYNLADLQPQTIDGYISGLVDSVAETLETFKCVTVTRESNAVFYEPTFLGHVASFYYISYKSVFHFDQRIQSTSSIFELMHVLAFSNEYAIFPVRHNEDKINMELAEELQYTTREPMDSPHVKTILLLFSYLYDLEFPNPEYVVDLKTVLDSVLRILQGMLDVTSNKGWLSCCIKIIHVMQMLIQGRWLNTPDFETIPHLSKSDAASLNEIISAKTGNELNLAELKQLYTRDASFVTNTLTTLLYDNHQVQRILKFVKQIPILSVSLKISESETESKRKVNFSETFTLKSNTSFEFIFDVVRKGGDDLLVPTKKFPKQKDEMWILCLGVPADDEIVFMKRFTVRKHTAVTCNVVTPEKKGRFDLVVYLLCDSYLGLDQQLSVSINLL